MIGSTDPAIGFAATPMDGGYTWTLTSRLGWFLRDIESRYGRRDLSWTPIGIEFCGEIPMLWYPGNCRNVSIMLTEKARLDPAEALFQLAHEAVHLLSPTGLRNPMVLEEGLATHYADHMSGVLGLLKISQVPSYVAAKSLVIELLNIDPAAIKKARSYVPSFVEFTPDLLIKCVPSLKGKAAEALCENFVR